MATKTISITEDAYERLKVRKGAHESFSDVINKVTGKRSLMELAGILSKEEGEELMKYVKEGRERSIKHRKEILQRMQSDS